MVTVHSRRSGRVGGFVGVSSDSDHRLTLYLCSNILCAATFVRPKRRLLLYILGGAPAAALLLAYNWYTLDSPFGFAYGYLLEDNAGFTQMKEGLFGITPPRWSSFYEITLGPRGLLTQSLFLWL